MKAGRAIAVAVMGFYLMSCANKSPPVREADYATKIVGRWQGTVGDLKETMSINGDRTFVCQLYSTGFISNTLSQSVPGRISGTWIITGASVTLKVTSAEHENLANKVASSTIVAFKENELILQSSRGETSLFRRVRAF
jgi:hypothetical protein